jgi:hypothetical protein
VLALVLTILATAAVISLVATAVTLRVVWVAVAVGMLKILLFAAARARASFSAIPPRLAPWRGMPTTAAAVSMAAAAGPSLLLLALQVLFLPRGNPTVSLGFEAFSRAGAIFSRRCKAVLA